jgi:hypothetical protein
LAGNSRPASVPSTLGVPEAAAPAAQTAAPLPDPPPPRAGALLPLFGATMALTVGTDMICVIICTLMLVR